MLRQNCFIYFHGHSAGGTNPSLLETMAMKNIIIAHDNEFNREVCGDSALYFIDSIGLKNKSELIEGNTEKCLGLKDTTYERAKEKYSWNNIIYAYESQLHRLKEIEL